MRRINKGLGLLVAIAAAACSDQTFTTDVPFRVTSVSPSPGATGISRDASIVVTFSEELDEASIESADAFKVELTNANGTAPITGERTWAQVGEAPWAVTFDPAEKLPFGATVKVTLATTITRKRDGARLPTPVSFELKTEPPPPLVLTRATPHDGVEGFAPNGAIALTFSEPVDCGTVGNALTFTQTADAHPRWAGATNAPVAGTWSCPTFPAGDALRLEGSCRAFDPTDATDYCTVRFEYAENARLGTSARFTVGVKGADGAHPEMALRSLRATTDGTTVHGFLAQSATIGGTVIDPPPLAPPAIAFDGDGRSAALKLTFAERIDCATLAEAVTVTEQIDPVVATRRSLPASRVATGTWSCANETQNPANFACEGGSCTYTFTATAPQGEPAPWLPSSRLDVSVQGGTWSATAAVVESVRSTSRSGQLPTTVASSFRIADPPAFQLAAIGPGHEASGVAPNTAIVLVFSEAPDCTRLAAGVTVTETLDSSLGGTTRTVTGAWACPNTPADDPTGDAYRCQGNACTATFTPTAPFASSSRVQVAISGGGATNALRSTRATSRAGTLPSTVNVSFTTGSPTPLAVIARAPEAGAAEVAASSTIRVAFSEGVRCASIDPCTSLADTACTLRVVEVADPLVGNTPIGSESGRLRTVRTGALDCTDGALEIAFTPTAPFAPSSRVEVRLEGGAHGEAVESALATSTGGQLPLDVSWSFEIAAPAPLVLVSTEPSSLATGVPAGATFKATFSSELACATAVLGTSVIVDAATAPKADGTAASTFQPVAGTVSCTGRTVSFTATTPPAPSSTVRVMLGNVALASTIRTASATTLGGAFREPTTVSWRVSDPAPLTVASTMPAGNPALNVSADSDVRVTFDRAIHCPSIATRFHVRDATAAADVSGTLVCSNGTTTGPAVAGTLAIFTPAAPFTEAHDYTVTVDAGVAAADATVVNSTTFGALAAPSTFAFRVAQAPLEILATTPVGGATTVAVSSDVTLRFSRDVSATSLVPCTAPNTPAACNVSVNRGAAYDEATFVSVTAGAYDDDTFTVTLLVADSTNAPDLAPGTSYFVRVKGGATGPLPATGGARLGADKSFSFTTDPSLTVLAQTPAPSATGVATSTAICIEFGGNVDTASLTQGGNQFTLGYTDALGRAVLVPLDGTTPYTVTGTRGYATNQVCLSLAESKVPWIAGSHRMFHATAYTARLTTTVKVAGRALPSAQTWSFTTRAAPLIASARIANAVVSESLIPGATEVPVNAAVTVRFAEPMSAASLTATTLRIEPVVDAGPFTAPVLSFDDAETPLAATLTGTLAYDTAYRVVVEGGTAGARTAAGEPIAGDGFWTFRTSPATTVTLLPREATIGPRTAFYVLASRDLHKPSVTADTVRLRASDTSVIPAYVAAVAQRPKQVLLSPFSTLTASTAGFVFSVDGLLDTRGNPIAAASSTVATNASMAAPATATCDGTSCAVSPAPTSASTLVVPNGHSTFTLTLPYAAGKDRMNPQAYRAKTTNDATGTIALTARTSPDGHCPAAGTSTPLTVTFVPGAVTPSATADSVQIAIASDDTLLHDCLYELRIKQRDTESIYGQAPATADCGTLPSAQIPTDFITPATCLATSNTNVGLRYTGEATAPTVTAIGYDRPSFVAFPTTTKAAGDERFVVKFSERPQAASLAAGITFTCGGNPVTATRTVRGNDVVLTPASPLTHGASCTIAVTNALKDRAGNALAATDSKTFTVDDAKPTLATATRDATVRRDAPFGRLVLTFSEAVQAATVTFDMGDATVARGSISVRTGATTHYGVATPSSDDPKVVYFAPTATLPAGVTVNLNDATSAAKIADLAGNVADAAQLAVP